MKPIEELRAQRALIQEHLRWLDDQIRQEELAGKSDAPTESALKSSEPPILKNDSQEQTVDKTVRAATESTADMLVGDRFVQSSSATDVKSVQVGCFIFFAVSILLFLFLLFGLPYLLD